MRHARPSSGSSTTRNGAEATPLERLRDLEAMIDFNTTVETNNPRVRRMAEALSARRRS